MPLSFNLLIHQTVVNEDFEAPCTSMPRWDYDVMFYRVSCIGLLTVALAFTVILTNVFIDIDGLMSKDKVQTSTSTEQTRNDPSDINDVISISTMPRDYLDDEYADKDYPDSSDLRSKRSLETNRLFHIKDPEVKKLVTDHLAELLDDLDEREYEIDDKSDSQTLSVNNNVTHKQKLANENNNVTEKCSNVTEDKNPMANDVRDITAKITENTSLITNEDGRVKENIVENELNSKIDETKDLSKENRNELLHLALQNVILQGIIENMNLNNVYKKIADFVKHFESNYLNMDRDEFKNMLKDIKFHSAPIMEENSVVDANHNDAIQKSNPENTKRSMKHVTDIVQSNMNFKPKDQNLIIKTIIDITAMPNGETNKESDMYPKDKLNGIIKVMYNGKTIEFKRIDDENNANTESVSNSPGDKNTENNHKISENIVKKYYKTEINKSNQSYIKKVVKDYLKRFQKVSDSSEKVFSRKRLKRHIKIRYDHDKKDTTTTTEKPKAKKDDELFVEIETHFDSKGAKGEKKKKLIRDLIEKIQKAIHSDKDEKKKKPKHWHVKKRIQNPLVSKSAATFLNKLMLPLETLTQRHLDPISKVMPVQKEVPFMPEHFGHDHWLQKYQGPRFFKKGINSAEMSKVDIDYNKVMSHNGIPQRLQKPLNTDISDEVLQDSEIFELGNIKFLMKDIDGTGFSIGFNQYTDEAPDTETMKLFSGLENIIQTYHQQYDQESVSDMQQQNIYDNTPNPDANLEDLHENQQQIDKSDQHLIQRRSIKNPKEFDHHTNNYRIVYSHNFLPYDSYQEIYEDKEHMARMKSMQLYNTEQENKSALFIDENVFEKDLKPAEILSIADLFERQKRSLNVKKISNVKIKKKSNRRYLNTKSMATKKVFKNKKRSKRQIDKIRIIARDVPHIHTKSEEDFFIVSDEKLFADRALVKDVIVPDGMYKEKMSSVENYELSPEKGDPYDNIISQSQKKTEGNYDIISPYIYEVSPFETQNEFSRHARHNSLMSKYPHIIFEDTHRSLDPGEEIFPESYYVEASTIAAIPEIVDIPTPNEKEIAELITPPKDNVNYRVSVKIRPKNTTGMSGFKEVHTSINKSYNKNGLMYTSLVNVSQVSKVENMNRNVSKRRVSNLSPSEANLKQQQDLIKSLIKQHKHRLDHQLKQLQIEREKLDIMNMETQDVILDKTTEANNSMNPNKMLQLAQEEARKLFIANSPTTAASTLLTESTLATTVTTKTTPYIQPIPDDTIKMKMINSIERNENITNELLKKIDQNTGILKTFLGKLIANIDSSTMKIDTDENKNEGTIQNNNEPILNAEVKPPDMIKNHVPYNFEDYHEHIPHIFFRNALRQSNGSIPFVYAYQQPYSMIPSKETSMASVVYHGHIHTNAMNNLKRDKIINNVDKANEQTSEKKEMDGDFWKPKPGEKVLHDFIMKNNTKFFLNGNTNTFKIISVNGQAKDVYTSGGLEVNSTKV